MDAYLAILLMFIFLGLILAVPIGLSITIYRWLTKKGYKTAGFVSAFLIVGTLCFYIYISVYPLDSFYKYDFEYYSGLTFPSSGIILSKDASYPDIHGTYSSDAVIELSNSDFNSLLNTVNNDKTFQTDTIMCGEYFDKVTNGIDTKNFIRIVKKGSLNIMFLKDNKTIIIEKRDYL